MKQTLTPNEAAKILKEYQINSISEDTIREGLKQDKFPFGVSIGKTSTVFIIYIKDFMNWIKEHFDCGGQANGISVS